jgi:hypothetical protein
MATPRFSRKRSMVAGSASWLALVAATSLGGAHAGTVRTEIKLPPQVFSSGPGRYRLIVQSYDRHVRASTSIPGSLRPRASAQRAVTADDLRDGVRIDLVELVEKTEATPTGPGMVVAWVEPGEPDLEFDARGARPTPGSFYGVAAAGGKLGDGSLQIHLDQRLRAG